MKKGSYALIESTRRENALVVGLRLPRMDEGQINSLFEELVDVGIRSDCSRYILRFGPRPVECLYSVFLAKMIMLQRKLAENKIVLVLCDMHPTVRNVFEACKLASYFLIVGTVEEAEALPFPEALPGEIAPPFSVPRCGGPHPGEEAP